MSALIIDGKRIAQIIKDEVRDEVARLEKTGNRPSLAVVLVGGDPASQVYVSNKKKACAYTGVRSLAYDLPEDTPEDNLLALINELAGRSDVHGILVQLPLPAHIDEKKILSAIPFKKDIDGFHPYNVGRMSQGDSLIMPCTPAGIVELLHRSGLPIAGKHCVVLGRSNIVGKPAAMLMLAENATVTICHSKTNGLSELCRSADILIAAVGRPGFVTADMVVDGAVVIDVGIHRQENGKLCGDVDFAGCVNKVSAITPVPGGVGPMTIAMLMKNCLRAYDLQNPS